MKNVELKDFQEQAIEDLRTECRTAIEESIKIHRQQVIVFTAPTGAGKTIMASALIEDILCDNPYSIFVWLSDSPELNEQSKEKIEKYANKIQFGQCDVITENSFDKETLDDGHIYFINTQKMSVTSKLTKQSDSRQFTIWETFKNTIEQKSDRLYFIIDEAHHGANDKKTANEAAKEVAKAKTIMQKFIKGSKDDNMPPMPVIIGMTATPKRFKDLVTGIKCTKRDVDVPVENVRDSGLLKEKIIISYPESDAIHKDMAVLQAATDEWKEKCDGWFKYCQKMNEFAVKPVFLVQVQNKVSNTDLNDCVKKIEERVGYKFKEGEVVNAFGEHDDLPISDMTIRYVEPSKIAEEESIKIVFFKDSLSTGWDCPRAETMMSFRTVSDETNIAQLLGRMVRTPLGHKVENDSLNDVHLFLPNFDAVTVQKVVQELQDSEGGKITEVDEEVVGSPKYEILSARPQIRRPKIHREPEGQQNLFSTLQPKTESYLEAKLEVESMEATPQYIDNKTKEVIVEAKMSESVEEGYEYADGINRLEIVEWINSLQLKTCKLNARPIKNGYLKPLCKIIRVLNESGMNTKALSEVQDEVVEMIRSYTEKLKADNEFQSKVDKLMEFKMHSQVVDIFGESVNKQLAFDLFSTTDTDIQRQFQKAEKELCDEGFGKAYLKKYYDTNSDYPQELDVIIFAKECIQKLDSYADKKYHLFKDEYLQKIDSYPEYKEQFKSIVCSADSINWLYLELRMDDIKYPLHQDVGSCTDHLFVNNEGTAKIKLDSDLERATLDEERKSPDFVCWLRNPKNADWALSIPYKMNGENKLMYPDFLIVRKDGNGGYKLDILEPHSESLADNLPKAQGLAKYADESYNLNLNRLSRIQLIRWKDNVPGTKLVRLDFKQSKIREEVMTKAGNDEDLDRIFEKYGE